MTSAWKDIPGYEGHYQVSDGGLVRSLDRRQQSYGGRAWLRKGKLMKLTTVKDKGYLVVSLVVDGVRTRRYVHDLVLSSFVGPRPPGLEACHGDGIPANNSINNLRWGTHSSNCLDKRAHGTMPLGQSHHMAVNSDAEIAKAKALLKVATIAETARRTGIKRETLDAIKAGRQWTHI